MAYELIETIEVGAGGAASIEFTSIPQDGVDLLLVTNLRDSSASTIRSLYVTLNNDSGASQYTILRLESNFGSVGSSSTTSNKFFMGYYPGASITSNTFGSQSIYVSNYTSSNKKSISLDSVTEDNGTSTNQQIAAGIYQGTSAITSIELDATGTNFVQYSTASLYKIY